MRQNLLFEQTPLDLGGSLRDQFARLDQETRVWLDAMLERGAKFEALEDDEVERRRARAVNPDELRIVIEERARGTRRGWYRPPSAQELARSRYAGSRLINNAWWVFVAYEPRTEREIGEGGRRTEHERAKQTHWPKGATP